MEVKKIRWNPFTKFNNFMDSSFSVKNKTTARKVTNSLIAVVIGLLISFIFLAIQGYSITDIILETINQSFSVLSDKFYIMLSVYIITALSIAIAFKAGIFNIGVPGQMIASGGIAFIIIAKAGGGANQYTYIFAFLVGVLCSVIVAVFTGVIKSYLGVHEVITTILLNWILFYFFHFLFKINDFIGNGGITLSLSNFVGSNNKHFVNSNNTGMIAMFTIIAILLAVGLAIILSFTTFGYKIKMAGINLNATKYSGSNKRRVTISIFAISGALSGLAGFIYYIILFQHVDFSSGQPQSIGFNAIAVALIAYSNPIGLLFSSVMYSTIDVGFFNLRKISGIDFKAEYYYVVIGILMLFISISALFEHFQPFKILSKYLVLFKYGKYKTKQDKDLFKKFKESELWKSENITELENYIEKINHSYKISYWLRYNIIKSTLKKLEKLKLEKSKFKLGKNSGKIKKIQLKIKVNQNELISNIKNLNDEKKLEAFEKIVEFKLKANNLLDKLGFFEKSDIRSSYKSNFKTLKKNKFSYILSLFELYKNHKFKKMKSYIKMLADNFNKKTKEKYELNVKTQDVINLYLKTKKEKEGIYNSKIEDMIMLQNINELITMERVVL